MEFTDIKTALPEPNTLVLIQRTKGQHYLGYRNDRPLSENIDASRDCHWYGRPINESDVNKSDSFFYCNFSDVTVVGWSSLAPVLNKAEKWDALDDKISKFYFDEEGNELGDSEGGDLLDIGESAASAFGYL